MIIKSMSRKTASFGQLANYMNKGESCNDKYESFYKNIFSTTLLIWFHLNMKKPYIYSTREHFYLIPLLDEADLLTTERSKSSKSFKKSLGGGLFCKDILFLGLKNCKKPQNQKKFKKVGLQDIHVCQNCAHARPFHELKKRKNIFLSMVCLMWKF